MAQHNNPTSCHCDDKKKQYQREGSDTTYEKHLDEHCYTQKDYKGHSESYPKTRHYDYSQAPEPSTGKGYVHVEQRHANKNEYFLLMDAEFCNSKAENPSTHETHSTKYTTTVNVHGEGQYPKQGYQGQYLHQSKDQHQSPATGLATAQGTNTYRTRNSKDLSVDDIASLVNAITSSSDSSVTVNLHSTVNVYGDTSGDCHRHLPQSPQCKPRTTDDGVGLPHGSARPNSDASVTLNLCSTVNMFGPVSNDHNDYIPPPAACKLLSDSISEDKAGGNHKDNQQRTGIHRGNPASRMEQNMKGNNGNCQGVPKGNTAMTVHLQRPERRPESYDDYRQLSRTYIRNAAADMQETTPKAFCNGDVGHKCHLNELVLKIDPRRKKWISEEINLLEAKGQTGDWIVTQHTDSPFLIHVKSKSGSILKFPINEIYSSKQTKLAIISSKKFPCLCRLLEHYEHHKLPNSSVYLGAAFHP